MEAGNAPLSEQLEQATLLVGSDPIKRAGVKLHLLRQRPLCNLQAQSRAQLHEARGPRKWGGVARQVDLHAAEALRQRQLREGVGREAGCGRGVKRERNNLQDLLI
jgi:hypothetical protein